MTQNPYLQTCIDYGLWPESSAINPCEDLASAVQLMQNLKIAFGISLFVRYANSMYVICTCKDEYPERFSYTVKYESTLHKERLPYVILRGVCAVIEREKIKVGKVKFEETIKYTLRLEYKVGDTWRKVTSVCEQGGRRFLNFDGLQLPFANDNPVEVRPLWKVS